MFKFILLQPAQLVKDGSLKGANVTEGTWAKFSCTIKKTGVIWWRIGSFDPNNRYTTEEIYQVHGLQARPDGRPIVKRRKLTEKIEIFATKDLNRTPIQCIFQFSTNNTKDFSPFVLLVVRPTTVNGTEKGNDFSSNIIKVLIFALYTDYNNI